MLLPSLSKGKEQAYKANCLNNLRQIGIATRLYIDDFGFRYPPGYLVETDAAGQTLTKDAYRAMGGYDAMPIDCFRNLVPAAQVRPLYPYIRPSKVFACPRDRGMSFVPRCEHGHEAKPTVFQTLGCSYQYNGGMLTCLSGGGFRLPNAAPHGLSLQSESWVPDPSLFIVFYEPPARLWPGRT
jgi:hypothetical protein